MGRVVPFSEIDTFLKGFSSKIPGCLVDTNFIFAALYEVHPFSDDAAFLFEKLAEYEIPIFSTVTTRTELMDLERRVMITEALMGMLAEKTKWRITHAVTQKLRAHKTWIDQQAHGDLLPILTDYRIKETKELFFPLKASGKNGWLEICKEFLNEMPKHMKQIETDLGLTYLNLRDSEIEKRYFPSKLDWDNMYAVSATTCLSASDAMLLNVLVSSNFPFIVSGDYDIAYGVLAESAAKVALIPDKLYRNRVKNLRF